MDLLTLSAAQEYTEEKIKEAGGMTSEGIAEKVTEVINEGNIIDSRVNELLAKKTFEPIVQSVKNYAYGNVISQPIDFKQKIHELKLYGKSELKKETLSNNIYLIDSFSDNKNGVDVSYDSETGTFTINGQATSDAHFSNHAYIVPSGYVGKIIIKASGSTAYKMAFRIITSNNSVLIKCGNNDYAYTFDGTEKEIKIYLYVNTTSELNNVTFNPQVNFGGKVLEYDVPKFEYVEKSNIGNCTVTVNDKAYDCGTVTLRSVEQPYNRKGKEMTFDYYEDAHIYVSDYIDLINGKLVTKVGFIENYNGEDIGTNYVCSSDSLKNGDMVLYVLDSPIVTDINVSIIDELSGSIEISNTLNAFTKCGYMMSKNESVTAIRQSYYPINITSRELAVDGRYVYVTNAYSSKSTLYKIDYSVECDPQIVAKYEDMTSGMLPNGMAIDDDYIYVCDRNPESYITNTRDYTGKLYVLNKSDLTEVKVIDLPWKACKIGIYKDYMYIALQMYGFVVYDISDKTNPTLIYTHTCELGKDEYQEWEFFTQGSKDYAIISGFGMGFDIWDITTPSAPTKAYEFSIHKHMGLATQCMGLALDYPKLYVTISSENGENNYNHNIPKGILKFDISDLSIFEQDEIPFVYGELPEYARGLYNGVGDSHPNAIVKIGTYLVANIEEKGLGVWNSETMKFIDTISVKDREVFVRPIRYAKDGRLFVIGGDVSNTTLNGIFEYRLANVLY